MTKSQTGDPFLLSNFFSRVLYIRILGRPGSFSFFRQNIWERDLHSIASHLTLHPLDYPDERGMLLFYLFLELSSRLPRDDPPQSLPGSHFRLKLSILNRH